MGGIGDVLEMTMTIGLTYKVRSRLRLRLFLVSETPYLHSIIKSLTLIDP